MKLLNFLSITLNDARLAYEYGVYVFFLGENFPNNFNLLEEVPEINDG